MLQFPGFNNKFTISDYPPVYQLAIPTEQVNVGSFSEAWWEEEQDCVFGYYLVEGCNGADHKSGALV